MTTVDIHHDFIVYPSGCGAHVDTLDVPLIVADHLEKMAARYPAEVFGPEGATYDGIAGTALRTVLTQEAKRLRGEIE